MIKNALYTFSFLPLTAFGAPSTKQKCDIYFNSGEIIPVSVPVAGQGTIVTLPFPVRDVVNPSQFMIQPKGAETQLGQVKNARSFLISLKKPDATDQVTFFMGGANDDKGTITLALSGSKFGRPVTNFCLTKTKSDGGKVNNDVLRHMDFMASMIRDEPVYRRQVISSRITVDEFKGKLSVKAIRVFKNNDLTGYTFLVTNTTANTVKLNLSSLAFGEPNRALAIHTDHEILEPCSKNRSLNPKENGCSTLVRFIVTGNLKPEYLTANQEFPFIVKPDFPPK